MVVVGRRSGSRKVVPLHSSVVNVRNVVVSNFVPVSEKHVHSVVIFEEFLYSVGKRVDFCLVFVDPVI